MFWVVSDLDDFPADFLDEAEVDFGDRRLLGVSATVVVAIPGVAEVVAMVPVGGRGR